MAKKTTSSIKKATPAKKAAKKSVTQRSTRQTSIVANVDIGFGNMLFIRGEGAGLSWEKGTPLENISSSEWALTIKKATGTITFKFLINDEIWSEGEDFSVKAGSKFVNSPIFVW